ncbi:MAG: chromosomal replication initiator protein DnaA [Eubacteriales bacterium]|nr:chromosomal replication initiator protein DnaA [Eubacteriales bacterium]
MPTQSTQPNLCDVWQQASELLKKSMNITAFNTFIGDLKPVANLLEADRPELVMETSSSFFQNVLTAQYAELISQKLGEAAGCPCGVRFILPAQREEYASRQNAPVRSEPTRSVFNPKYTFDSFVIGNSNRFAHAAALAVAEAPAMAYNPLFIYGGVGLGKTHLLHAIGHHVTQQNPDAKVTYISSEKFTNELIQAISNNSTEAFRQKYRHEDVLLIDDVQFLAGKASTQEEFFHTFNVLFEAQKQIILSSDRPPKQINIEDRLRSRFEWGLIADIQAPDLETRIAILHKKARLENIDIPDDDVYEFIALRSENNIRELEGSLNRAVAYSRVSQRPLDMALVQEALKDIISDSSSRLATPETIINMVSERFSISIADLKGKSKQKEIASARQIAMYLTRELTDLSLPRLGEVFGRDHTTVLHGWKAVSNRMAEDSELRTQLADMREELIGH